MSKWVWVKKGPGRYSLVKKSSLTGDELLERPPDPLIPGAPQVPMDHVHLPPGDQRRLSIQSGRRIETWGDLRRYCTENGSRVVEKGDRVHKALEETRGSEVAERVRRRKRDATLDFPFDKLIPRR